jgi:hypothetical protein
MRRQLQLTLVAIAAISVVHCAQGSTGTGGTGPGDDDATTGYIPPNLTTSSADVSTGTGYMAGGTGDTTTSTGAGGSGGSSTTTTTATTTATTTTSVSVSSSSGGPVICDPTNPSLECGANMHCVPTPTGDPICEPPVGPGGAYAACVTRAECGAPLECVNDGSDNCCMTWCSSNADCGGGENCTFLNTPVYVGAIEYGVCWDGLPCVI